MKRVHPRFVYYVITALHDFAFSLIAATYALFLLSHGLSALQMNAVNAAFMIGNIVFEIPTGVYADFFGRKQSVIVHGLLLFVSGLVYAVSSDFRMFVLAEILGAISYTFASGALDAWAADNIGEDWIDRTDFIFSRGQVFGKVASIIGGLAGGLLGAINLAYPFYALSIGALLISMIAYFYMTEDKPKKTGLNWREGARGMETIARESFRYGLRRPVVLWLMISTFIAQCAFQPLNMFWAPRFSAMAGNSVSLMGWAWAVMALMMTGGSLLCGFLMGKKVAYWKIMAINTVLLGVPVLISSLSPVFAVAAGVFFLYEIGRGIDRPLKMSYLNKYIVPNKRATLLSFDSLIGRLGAVIGLFAFGVLADRTSYSTAWIASGLILLTLVPVYLNIKRQEQATVGSTGTNNQIRPA